MSGSLLLIAAVWLVLLAPLLLRNQRPVRRTAQALGETRVLHRGGSTLKAKRKLKPAEGLYMGSDDDELELVEAEPEYVLLEDEDTVGSAAGKPGKSRGLRAFMEPKGKAQASTAGGATGGAVDSEQARGAQDGEDVIDGEVVEGAAGEKAGKTGKASGVEGAKVADATAAVVDGEVVSEGAAEAGKGSEGGKGSDKTTDASDAPAESVAAADATQGSAVRYTAQDEMATGEFAPVKEASSTASAEGADGAAESAGTAESTESAESGDKTAEAAEPTDENLQARQRAYEAVPAGHLRGGDVKVSSELVDEVDAAPTDKSLDILEDSDELSEADLKYLAARRGRGVYDPIASAELARQRQDRRKKVLFGLLALCALTFGFSMYAGGAVWLSFIAMVAFTGFYLVMLRRQAIEERELRHRRLVRMRRARLGVRNTEDNELGVPDRLVRPGAVILETDEDDPAFSNLEYADGSDFFDAYDTNGARGTGVGGGAASAAGARPARGSGQPAPADPDEEYLDPRSGIRAV